MALACRPERPKKTISFPAAWSRKTSYLRSFIFEEISRIGATAANIFVASKTNYNTTRICARNRWLSFIFMARQASRLELAAAH